MFPMRTGKVVRWSTHCFMYDQRFGRIRTVPILSVSKSLRAATQKIFYPSDLSCLRSCTLLSQRDAACIAVIDSTTWPRTRHSLKLKSKGSDMVQPVLLLVLCQHFFKCIMARYLLNRLILSTPTIARLSSCLIGDSPHVDRLMFQSGNPWQTHVLYGVFDS